MSHRYLSSVFGFILIGLLGSFVFLSSRSQAEPAKENAQVTIKTIEYPQLVEAVKAARGKVVVVDVWGIFCEPCKKEFPHLVEMHEKYGKDGLVCMSVCIPQKTTAADQAKALAFLTDKKATFSNYLLEDGWTVCDIKWGIGSVPATFVFDREGRRSRKFTSEDPNNPYGMKGVESLVKELLRPKQ